MDECIEQDILREFLLANKAEVKHMSIFEYNEEDVRQVIREESYEEGRETGRIEGKIEDILELLKEKELDPDDIRFSPENLAKLIALTERKAINSTVAKGVFEKLFDKNVDPEQYVEEHGLKMVDDREALRRAVEKVIAANPQSVEDYRGGKERAVGYLVGQTMKAMKGKADPVIVNGLLKELLH